MVVKLENESGIWQNIVKFKYLQTDSVVSVKHKQSDSPMWSDLLKIKEIYLQGRKLKVNNGASTLVWRDTWLYNDPLCSRSPDLFKLCDCDQKDIYVSQLISGLVPVSFCRWLTLELSNEWEKIMEDIFEINLVDEKDKVVWKLESNGTFSVKSTYNALTSSEGGLSHKCIWKGKIPPKIKIFL